MNYTDSFAKRVSLSFVNGDPNGPIECALDYWAGVAYRIPRSCVSLSKWNCIDDLSKRSGVYFLFGKEVLLFGEENKDFIYKDFVYVGQARTDNDGDGILRRLKQHLKPKGQKDLWKEHWTEAIAFTDKNRWMGPTEISWLENHFHNLVNADQFRIKNGNEPNKPAVSLAKEEEIKAYAANARAVMGVLRPRLFESARQQSVPADSGQVTSDSEITQGDFRISHGDGVAYGRYTSDGFVVFKGSKIKKTVAAGSCPKYVLKQRLELYAPIISADSTLLEDISFDSPSGGACFVTGTSTNGREAWKTTDGRSLREVEESEAKDI